MRINSQPMMLKEAPRAIAVSPFGDRVYLANPGVAGSLRNLRRPRGTVTVVDPHARSEVARILVGRNPSGIAVDPDGERPVPRRTVRSNRRP